MKKLFLFLLLILSLISCSNDDKYEEDDKDEFLEYHDLRYHVSDSLYFEQSIENETSPTVLFNNSDTLMFIRQEFNTYLQDSFSFESEDVDFKYFVNRKDILVNIPLEFVGFKIFILSDRIYELKDKQFFTKNPGSNSIETINLPSKMKVTITKTLIKKHYRLNFELIYFDHRLKEEKSLNGIWNGYYLIGSRDDIVYESI